MAYRVKAYTLREESTESGTRYFISFKDGQGKSHELEVSEQFFMEFRQMERRNRNLLQWDERHREFSEVWDETLNSNTGGWTYSPVKYWPNNKNDKISFFAYAPYETSGSREKKRA